MSNPDVFEKLDTGLSIALRAWEEAKDAKDTKDTSDPEAGISVSFRYEGDLGHNRGTGLRDAHGLE